MTFSRVAWLLTVAVAVITAIVLLISDYKGYAVVFLAIAAAAAINLR